MKAREMINRLRVTCAVLALSLSAVLVMAAGGGLLLASAVAAVIGLLVLIVTIPDCKDEDRNIHIVYEVIDDIEYKYGR